MPAERTVRTGEWKTMLDGCGREIDHLRLSLTDHCNLACRYCIPNLKRHGSQIISAAFAYEAVRRLSDAHGIRHVRLTGGEPLLYPGLGRLIDRLSKLNSLYEVTLTTNAQTLGRHAKALRTAGLARVNVSLDTLKPERFAELTRGGRLAHTLAGVEAAIGVGLTPVKLNVVAQRGLNEDELPEIAAWGLARGCVVRFLEVMPIGPVAHVMDHHLVPASEILDRLSGHFDLRPIPQSIGQPATDYVASSGDVSGVIGLIAPTTRPFCDRCRRLRLTSHGELVPCVHDRRKTSLMPAWDGRCLDVDRFDALVAAAVMAKPAVGPQNQAACMVSIGG